MTPLREDFDILVHDSGVDVTFKPTKSEYSFARLADPEDIEWYGPIMDSPPGPACWHRRHRQLRHS